MTAYKQYVRDAKKSEAVLAAKLSALKRRQRKIRTILEAEQARCSRLIRAKQVLKAEASLQLLRRYPIEISDVSKFTEDVCIQYCRERLCAALGWVPQRQCRVFCLPSPAADGVVSAKQRWLARTLEHSKRCLKDDVSTIDAVARHGAWGTGASQFGRATASGLS